MVSFSKIIKYIWPQIRKYWISFSFVFIGYTIGIIFDNIIKPYLYKDLIDGLSSSVSRDLILKESIKIISMIAISIIIHNIGYRVGDYMIAKSESKVMKNLYDFSFKKLLIHSYNFFSNNFSGSIIAKTKRFVSSFETLFDIISFQIFFSIVTIIGILYVLFIKAPILAIIFLVWAFIYIGITILFINKKIKYDSLEAEADSLVTARLSDVITNILNVKLFNNRSFEEQEFFNITSDEEKKRRKSWYFGNFQNLIQALLMAILQILILFVAISMWYKGDLSIGTIVLIQMYMFNLFSILWTLGRSLTKAAKSLTNMKEVIDIFELNPDILDKIDNEKLAIQNGHIVFNKVSFSYKEGVNIMRDFNLEIRPKENIGIVGHSGAGKSTITKLLLRFVDTTSGSIMIDGQDIKNIKQEDLRSVISYVPQDSLLFHRTIKENIKYGNMNATDKEIFDVSKKTYTHDFINNLPKKYDTFVGERGVKLSGGERQRIAIARAMIKNAPILILDEATSSLDSISEQFIQKAFNELMKDKTTIVIAHRLSTIQKMDRIIVLDEGKIVEDGTHNELINKNGHYKKLWDHQVGGFIE